MVGAGVDVENKAGSSKIPKVFLELLVFSFFEVISNEVKGWQAAFKLENVGYGFCKPLSCWYWSISNKNRL